MMKDLSLKERHGIQNNGTEHSKGNIIADIETSTDSLGELYYTALWST